MTEHLTEDEVIAFVPGLTRTRLFAFIETRLVIPLRRETENSVVHSYRQVDCARLQLLLELTDDLDLDENALSLVIALIDQLHAARREILAIARAVEAESHDVRIRIGKSILEGIK